MPLSSAFTEESLILVGRLSEKLKARSLFMGTAESCTGGLAAALCTEVPGSSTWFKGGIVAYDNTVKHAILEVPHAILDAEGAVSEAVVRAMVQGAIRVLDVQAALAISGVAGPDGGSLEKPVGTVWIAAGVVHTLDVDMDLSQVTAKPRGLAEPYIKAECHQFSGGRSDVRRAAALAALAMLDRILDTGYNLEK